MCEVCYGPNRTGCWGRSDLRSKPLGDRCRWWVAFVGRTVFILSPDFCVFAGLNNTVCTIILCCCISHSICDY